MRRAAVVGVLLMGCTQQAKGVVPLSLSGPWSQSSDAQTAASPLVTVTTAAAGEVTAKSTGGSVFDCGCNAVSKRIELGREVSCDARLEFELSATGDATDLDSMSLEVRFLTADAASGAFYTGAGFAASTFNGHSNCAVRWKNLFPKVPAVKAGHNVVELRGLDPTRSGQCDKPFTAVEVHLQRYGCTENTETTLTVKNAQLVLPTAS